MKIWKNKLKYVKLCLISPALEIALNSIYIISFLIIFAYFGSNGKYFNDKQISKFTESYLNYDIFKSINTDSDYKSYLINLINKLFSLDPSGEKLPILIPINAVRITRFINNDCNDEDYQISCINDYQCVIDSMKKSFKHKCGEIYSNSNKETNGKKYFLENLVNNFEGYFSSYDLLHEGKSIEVTLNNLNNKMSEIDEFISNKNLKFISIEINMKIPLNNNYIDVILGLEMNEYFEHIYKYISIYVFNNKRVAEDNLLLVIIHFYIVSAIINFVKLIYEIIVKTDIAIHIFSFINEACNVVLIVFLMLYMNIDTKLNLNIDLKKFETHLIYISVIKYLKIIIIIVLMGIPLRLLSLISWWKWFSSPFVKVANILFRMFPGVIISFLFSVIFLIDFSISNYLIFQDIFSEYQNFYYTLLNIFNLKIITYLYQEDNNSKIFHNLTHSKYVFIFLLFQYFFIFLSLSIFISTFVSLFKKAQAIEEPKQEKEYIIKMDNLIEKLKENVEEKNIELIGINKQILWLKLSSKNNPSKNNRVEIILFKNSQQIISFLKYLFALKPELQFKNLFNLINIVIEVSHYETINWNLELLQIEDLINWLIFVGCKIPLIIYCEPNFANNFHMRLHKVYNLIKFVNDKDELETIMNKKDFGSFVIDNKTVFTIKAKRKNHKYK